MSPHCNSDAINFTKELLSIYLESRDLKKLKSMLSENITWIGLSLQEICNNQSQFFSALETDMQFWGQIYKIDSFALNCKEYNNQYLVYGTVYVLNYYSNNIEPYPFNLKISMLCGTVEDKLILLNAHISLPVTSTSVSPEGDLVSHLLSKNKDKDLLSQLSESTRMLIEKTEILQSLTDNIWGGVEICKCNKDCTISYISEGFSQLTGYSYEELADINYSHLALVYPEDVNYFTYQIEEQTKNSYHFSLEYRIVKKDGKVIWVLDNGSKLVDSEGECYNQCILTDITKHKEQESALKMAEARYEVALKLSDITMFEYNILTKQLNMYGEIASNYNIATVVENGPNTLMEKGIILPESHEQYKAMYRKIDSGENYASCIVRTKKANGEENPYELSLTTVYDQNGTAVRAIGVRKNVSDLHNLQREHEYSKNLMSGKHLIFEANIDTDVFTYINNDWKSKLKVIDIDSFKQTICIATEQIVCKDSQENFAMHFSKKYIENQIEKGNNIFTFEYKSKGNDNKFVWHEATVNIIRDSIFNQLNIRVLIGNIHTKKVKQERALDERRFYESMISRANIAYEVNITANKATTRPSQWLDYYGISTHNNYNTMINSIANNVVHPEDKLYFVEFFSRTNITDAFYSGNKQLIATYRKLNTDGEYHWYNCTLHIYEDPASDDIKAFYYVEDVHKIKIEEIKLKQAAMVDSLTGLYNRAASMQLIEEFLQSSDAKNSQHAFFIIDLDFFKDINDNYGHHYGDIVLTETAEKIKSCFRVDDIVGRLGGDEFCVFMKNTSNMELLKIKALQVQDCVGHINKNTSYNINIACSIGIAIYNEDGKNFNELYINSDKALYSAKKAGRNAFCFYSNCKE